jgi:hypothetical protein
MHNVGAQFAQPSCLTYDINMIDGARGTTRARKAIIELGIDRLRETQLV